MADGLTRKGKRKYGFLHAAALVMGVSVTSFLMGQSAYADTLHGYCTGTGNSCSDNSNNTPESLNPPQFGFHGSGSTETGDLWYVFLLPTSASNPASFGVTGTVNGTASLLNGGTPWSSGQLDAYLGISANPTNPIGAYGAGGSSYEVYKFDLGTQTLTGTTGPEETTLTGLPTDSYILAFLNVGGNWSGTANSGAILETGSPGSVTTVAPEPASLFLLGTGVIGLASLMRRRQATHRL